SSAGVRTRCTEGQTGGDSPATCSALTGVEELSDIRRVRPPFATIVSARSIAEKLREPGLVLDFLVQDREREVVGAVILPGSHIADVRVAADRALFGGEQNL